MICQNKQVYNVCTRMTQSILVHYDLEN